MLMFKELFATALLSTCVGAKPLTPKKISNNTFYGAYCMRTFDELSEVLVEFGWSGETFSYTHTIDDEIYCYGMYYNNFYELYSLNIYYDGSIFHFNYYGGEEELIASYTYWTDDSWAEQDMSKYIIYFTYPYTMDNANAKVFNMFFTQTANSNTEYYTGWYTFSHIQNMNSWSVMGNITANNTIYNFLGSGASIYSRYYSPDYNLDFDLYSSSEWHSSRSVYFTGVLIPKAVKTYMLSQGTFDFIPDTTQSDFKDLFFAIADTPVRLITDMFHFELLGIDLGIAIMSILTLLVIVVIVKKIV